LETKPQIVYFHHGGAKGGAPLSLLYVLQHLKNRVDVHVVSCMCSSEVVGLYSKHGFEASLSKMPFFAHSTLKHWKFNVADIVAISKWFLFYPFAVLNFYKSIKHRPAVVHLNSSGLAPYAWVAKLKGIPVVCHVREPLAEGHFGFRRAVLRFFLRTFVDHTIAICESNGDDTRVPKSLLSIVYNPVSLEKFDVNLNLKECRKNLGLPDDSFAVLFAGGSNSVVKGVEDFLCAMSVASDSIPNLICLMPSFDRSSIKSVEALDALEKLGERVYAADFTYEIEKWIAASNAVYALHKKPHFSRTVAEAGMMKRPVVVYRIAGLSEVVEHEVNGLVAPLDDQAAVVSATIKLAAEPHFRESLGHSGFNLAIERFEASASARSLFFVYERLIEG
jgi:glycosyltransferase involved in cell wall biosynthesis